MVVAFSLAGTLDFDPLTDSLEASSGAVRLEAPVGDRLPRLDSIPANPASCHRLTTVPQAVVAVSPNSERLQLSAPRSRHGTAHDYSELPVLLKAKGKCTTDHISAAGSWFRYRGHLENISGNLFLGVTNAFTDDER